MEPKYPALRTIASIYRWLGGFIIVLTIVFIIVGVINVFVNQEFLGGGIFGFLGAALGVVFGSIVVLFIYAAFGMFFSMLPFAVAEAIEVFLDIEENTRTK